MSLMRFFRKHNKGMLAVFMVGLMIVFLLPASMKRFGQRDPGKQVIGTSFGKKIRLAELWTTEGETRILDALARSMPDSSGAFEWRAFVAYSKDQQYVLDYHLLIREAKHMGLTIPLDQVDAALTEAKVPAALVNSIVKAQGISLKALRTAVANYLLAQEAYLTALRNIGVSEPEMRSLFVLISERINAAIAPIAAEDLTDDIGQPTDKQLTSYFAENLQRFNLPHRIVVEYLEVDLDEVKKDIKITAFSARQYWEDHKHDFTMTTTAPATGSASTTQAGETQPAEVKRVLSFEEALPKVIEKLTDDKARRKAVDTMMTARSQADAFWQGATIDEKTRLPERPKTVANYEELAEKISKQKHVAVHYHRSALVDREAAAELAGIREAFVRQRGRRVWFDDYAFQVVPLVQSVDRADSLVLVRDQDSRLLYRGSVERPDGLYIFRVTEVQPSRPAESLNEVRNKVIREWTLDQAYKQAGQLAKELKKNAERVKLSELVASDDKNVKALLEKIHLDEPNVVTFPRRAYAYSGQMAGPRLTGVKMNSQRFADLCFDKLWKQPTTQPDGQFTTVLIEDPLGRTVYVVQLLEKQPALMDEYEKVKHFLAQLALSQKRREFAWLWFDPTHVRERTEFQSAQAKR